MITLVINGRQIRAAAGQTILEAARDNGIRIPTLCHDPSLTPFGGCRMCLVEVAGARGPVASCTTPATDGMVVETNTERVEALRRGVLELLLSNHPNDCLTCEQTGKCGLQNLAYRYGVRFNTYLGKTRPKLDVDENPFIARDNEKCILCGKCVRACAEVIGESAIDFAGRGFDVKISTGTSGLLDSPCELCGQCVAVCPTGSLTEKKRAGHGRCFQIEKRVKTTCGYCGTGCTMYLDVADGRIVGSVGDPESPANKGQLCVKGRFGYDYPHHPDRLTNPLIRKDGVLTPAGWDEALDYVAQRLLAIKAAHGPDSIAAFSSSRATNEDNYVFQKFMRANIGTNNIDNCART